LRKIPYRTALAGSDRHLARFGMWLLLGLEFELAADIIGSVISPTWQDVGMLGAIAVIRTFLNYFLEKDLEEAEERGGGHQGRPRRPFAVIDRPRGNSAARLVGVICDERKSSPAVVAPDAASS
jgi:hypothetical protein